MFVPFDSAVACDLHATLDGEPLIFTNPIARGQSGPVTITTDEEALADGRRSLGAYLQKQGVELRKANLPKGPRPKE